MRLFTAVDLSSEVARSMEQLQQGCKIYVPCQRWQKIRNMHITLHFLGEVADTTVPSLQAKLREETPSYSGFTLTLHDWGAFPSETRPRVVWVGVQEQPALVELQHGLASMMERHGYQEEGKRYTPHITVGRGPKGNDLPALRQQMPVPSIRWKVDSLVLYQSIFGPDGIQYKPLDRYPLSFE